MLHDLTSRVHFFISAVGSVGDCLLADALSRFSRENPQVEIVTRMRDSRECYASVQEQTSDVAFVVQEQFFQNVSSTAIFQEQMRLLTFDPILAAPVNGLALPREKEIVIPWNADFMRWRQQRLSISRHPNVSLSSIPMALPLLREGYWLVAPQTAADSAAACWEGLRSLPLADPPPARTVYCVEEQGRRHAGTDLLLDILRTQLKGREGIHWLMG